ncbi:CRISPR-associated endonuclease Cas1 [Belliella kenyensis]|uniref:CRISPR-associated endonuclease Cas1 n=1 Tax=Belliella kenyensis TaxID=1472724 RepID=A0ABV8ESB2_9BACT|nr:CRISPR-associated endonuclease Cas1 [Belliella kenyensis]MCH7402129.1 CRISPR-associated endonuclease Cas1 [Belliella kenyensis]MDN3601644.1 CRISPR-associated endonuclease Cas1 [Belliella kenyensis]
MHLVINTYGATLQKENNLFVITTPEGKQTFPPDIVKSISISKSARITSDAIILAIKHQVEVLFVNDLGNPEGRVWSVQYGSISNIRKAQVNFLYSKASLPWVKELIYQKLDSQVALLLTLHPEEDQQQLFNFFKSSINSIEDYKKKVKDVEGEFISDVAPTIRGWEGAAGKRYFQSIAKLMPASFSFDARDRQPAKDPFNALLNYAYGILYGKIEGALIKAGIDPYVGVFHRDDYNRPALVYDIIERYRTWMDYVVIQLCLAEAFPLEAFDQEKPDTALLLGPLAKRILIQSVNDYLGEIILLNGKSLSRISHIDDDMHKLARFFTQNASI